MFRLLLVFFRIDKIREINARFRAGVIPRTPLIRLALFALSLYIIVFFGLLAFKFWDIMSGGKL